MWSPIRDLNFTVALAYTDAKTEVAFTSSSAVASSYSTIDVRLAFRKNQWGLGFFVNNVGDERGVTGAQQVSAFGAPGYTDYYLIRPRVVGPSRSYDMSL